MYEVLKKYVSSSYILYWYRCKYKCTYSMTFKKKMERQHAKWGNFFANHMSHKELVYKGLLQLNNKKQMT